MSDAEQSPDGSWKMPKAVKPSISGRPNPAPISVMNNSERIREILSDEFPEIEYSVRVHNAVKRISGTLPTHQPEADHLQQAPKMIGELRESLIDKLVEFDDSWPREADGNIIDQLLPTIAAHLQAAIREAEQHGITKGHRIQAEATLDRYADHVNMNKFLPAQVEAWRYEEQQLKQEGA